ncbi:MAG TPA: ABC transporter permease subunit [Arachnia sp.]|nr:ABC transporter permease subunit [Arachnia sp.]HMT86943.1 ABC transporter permease subunit [Arachnia sp.]
MNIRKTPWGAIAVIALLGIVLAGPFLAPHDPELVDLANRLAGPSSSHWLGTDNLGRDILSRVLTGAQVTVGLSLLALALAILIGVPLGLLSGWAGGRFDWFTMRIVDTFIALPDYIVAIILSGLLGPGFVNMLIAILVVKWVGYTRLTRSLVMQEKTRDYLMISKLAGARPRRILRQHMIPHIVGPTLALATMDIGKVILLVASLSFIGMGVQPPSPEWGAMLNDGRAYFAQAPQLMVIPGLAIFVVVALATWLGDQLMKRYAIGAEDERMAHAAA